MGKDSANSLEELRVDGGPGDHVVPPQFQADILGVPVVRPSVTETTALGAAYLAGIGVRLWRIAPETPVAKDRLFEPRMLASQTTSLRDRWSEAVSRSKVWLKD